MQANLLLLHFKDMAFFFFFPNQMKVCGKSLSTTFPTVFTHFSPLCHILVILALLLFFSF